MIPDRLDVSVKSTVREFVIRRKRFTIETVESVAIDLRVRVYWTIRF